MAKVMMRQLSARALNDIHRWLHLILTTILKHKLCYYPHFLEEETEAQKTEAVVPRSDGHQGQEAEFKVSPGLNLPIPSVLKDVV